MTIRTMFSKNNYKEILDPLRLVTEFEDARLYNGDFPRNRQDTNEFELI